MLRVVAGLPKASLKRHFIRISDRLDDYNVVVNPSPKLFDVFMEAHGDSRTDFKRDDVATWQKAWGDDYRFGLIFSKQTGDLVFSYHTVQYKSLGFQPDFQHLGMAWIPENYRGRPILTMVTEHLRAAEQMKKKNMLACNVHWSQNFWKQATGSSDISKCTYYVSYYEPEELRMPKKMESKGVAVKGIDSETLEDVVKYDQTIFPFARSKWIRSHFNEGIGRIAYDSNGEPVGIGCVSTYPSGECVISPLYAESKPVAQLIFASILEELFSRSKPFWRLQVRSNDQCRESFEWIAPFLRSSSSLRRSHLSNLCYSLYPPQFFFKFPKVFVNAHPTNGPC